MIRIQSKNKSISPEIMYLNQAYIVEVDIVFDRQEGVVVETTYRVLMTTGEWSHYRSSEYDISPLTEWLDSRCEKRHEPQEEVRAPLYDDPL